MKRGNFAIYWCEARVRMGKNRIVGAYRPGREKPWDEGGILVFIRWTDGWCENDEVVCLTGNLIEHVIDRNVWQVDMLHLFVSKQATKNSRREGINILRMV